MIPQIDLNKIPVPDSYWYMTSDEYRVGVCQMLADLQRLAQNDGCIAAAWALSVFEKLSQ